MNLPRKLGMENRDLIPELKRLGITVASHSSALETRCSAESPGEAGAQSRRQGPSPMLSDVRTNMRMEEATTQQAAKGAGVHAPTEERQTGQTPDSHQAKTR